MGWRSKPRTLNEELLAEGPREAEPRSERCHERSSLVRFGVAVALLTVVPTYLIYYVVQPMPGATVVKQIVFDGVLMLILGIVAAFMYRTPAQA